MQLKKISIRILKAFGIYLVLNTIFTAVYYYATVDSEEQHWNIPNDQAADFFKMFWYSSTVSSTVGFGDMYPVSNKLKILTIIHQFFVVIGFISTIITIGSLHKEYEGKYIGTAVGSIIGSLTGPKDILD